MCSVAKSCLTFCNRMDCSQSGSSVRGISQARILEQVSISFFRGSSQPRDWSHISSFGSWNVCHLATWEALIVTITFIEHLLLGDFLSPFYMLFSFSVWKSQIPKMYQTSYRREIRGNAILNREVRESPWGPLLLKEKLNYSPVSCIWMAVNAEKNSAPVGPLPPGRFR